MFTFNRSFKHLGSKKLVVFGVYIRVVCLPRALFRAEYIVSWIAFCHALCFRAPVCSLCWSTINLPRAKLASFFSAKAIYSACWRCSERNARVFDAKSIPSALVIDVMVGEWNLSSTNILGRSWRDLE
jgi:hypothetical protein